jgi:predicted ATP-grasp superfamily ATP-dependent carboligase
MPVEAPNPPILLTAADYNGTLAAARCLGRAGVPVEMADGRWLTSGRWSRYVSRRFSAPGPEHPHQFMEWLLSFGKRGPGRVLYPTSDDVAFLYALHREQLQLHFRLYQPPIETIYTLLNKRRLQQAARAVGLEMPQSWLPGNDGDLASLSATLRFPVIIKPQTQILFFPHPKGALVHQPSELAAAYSSFTRSAKYAGELLSFDPTAGRPMLQEFYPRAALGIYNLSGFIDMAGDLLVVRASRKLLQRPRRLGIGICFERAPVREDLVERLAALCRHVGYFGVFEVEFIEDGDRMLLLDFNPRFYGEMGFDSARGMLLPMFVYYAAMGRREDLRRAVEAGRAAGEARVRAFCHRFQLEVVLWTQRFSGRLSRSEVSRWRSWLSVHRGYVVDAVLDRDDWFPGLVEVAAHLYDCVRHPRGFMNQILDG